MSTHTAPTAPRRALSFFKKELMPLVVMLALLMAGRDCLANHYKVPSSSMQNTLMPGDRVVVDMRAYGLRLPFTSVELLQTGQPQRGDVAVFDSPQDGTRLIKRIVAVAGDHVALRNGHLSLNGVPMQRASDAGVEDFGRHVALLDLGAGGGPDVAGLIVPSGKLLVLGDHRGNSYDGRFFGLVDAAKVYGKASHVYYRRGEGFTWKAL